MACPMLCEEPLSAGPSPSRRELNRLLGLIVEDVIRSCDHSNVFAKAVPIAQIADYRDFVSVEDEMHLGKIQGRVRMSYYTCAEDLGRDFELIVTNAIAYNSPGCGQHGYIPLIQWAQDLLQCAHQHLEDHRASLSEAGIHAIDIMPLASSKPALTVRLPHHDTGASTPGSSPLSSLQALVAACELAAEREGMDTWDHNYYDELMAEGHALSGSDNQRSSGSENDASGNANNFGGHVAVQPANTHRHKAVVQPCQAHANGCQSHASNRGMLGSQSGDTAPKYRRHKSKVFIRPNKVVYLPTTFMEEHFDPACLPINCEMLVETDAGVQHERHMVTIKAVPRQGLSTMYCMTNVMKFQQQYLNWQILNWTKIDDHHIKIHLQSPGSSSSQSAARSLSLRVDEHTYDGHKRKSESGTPRSTVIKHKLGEQHVQPPALHQLEHASSDCLPDATTHVNYRSAVGGFGSKPGFTAARTLSLPTPPVAQPMPLKAQPQFGNPMNYILQFNSGDASHCMLTDAQQLNGGGLFFGTGGLLSHSKGMLGLGALGQARFPAAPLGSMRSHGSMELDLALQCDGAAMRAGVQEFEEDGMSARLPGSCDGASAFKRYKADMRRAEQHDSSSVLFPHVDLSYPPLVVSGHNLGYSL